MSNENTFEDEFDGYVDDWYCNACNHGPIGTEVDRCPKCGQSWEDN